MTKLSLITLKQVFLVKPEYKIMVLVPKKPKIKKKKMKYIVLNKILNQTVIVLSKYSFLLMVDFLPSESGQYHLTLKKNKKTKRTNSVTKF